MQADDHTGEQPHTDAELDAFEHAARVVLTGALTAQRDLLAELGYPTDGRAWMSVPVDDILDAARRRDADRDPERRLTGAPPPLARQPRTDHIDWFLLNPGFAASLKHPTAAHERICQALYPSNTVLVAGLIVQVLVDNTGVNVATLLQQTSTNLQSLGEHTGQLEFAKARNHTAGTRVVTFDGMFSSGGVVQLMTALTRFNRAWRAAELARLDMLQDHAVIADRIYVPHRADVRTCKVLTSIQQHNGYRDSPRFLEALETKWPEGVKVGLRWRALRKAALRRGLAINPDHDVLDHSPRSRVDYLAHCIPDAELAALASEAQDDIHADALESFTKPEVAARLAQAKANDELMDIGPTVCTNRGNAPGDPTTPCSLGLAACFVCPDGYRTLDHIPGLLALQDYTEIIHNHDPGEWVDGEAGVLNYYATETLKHFPQAAVQTARETMHRDAELITIHHLYTEMRR